MFSFLSTIISAIETIADEMDPALLIVNRKVLASPNLTLEKTLKNILRTEEQNSDDVDREEIVGFIQKLLVGFRRADYPNAGGERIKMPVTPSEVLAKIDPNKLLDSNSDYYLAPAAVLYRPDLIPEDYKNCGEFRIVYGFRKPINPDSNSVSSNEYVKRFYLIFETVPKFPDGTRVQRIKTCQDIAQTWNGFRNKIGSNAVIQRPEEVAQALETFFYETVLEKDGIRHGRAMQMGNLGSTDTPLGQVRGNFQSFERSGGDNEINRIWQLREWIVGEAHPNDGKPYFNPRPMANSTLPQFFSDVFDGELGDLQKRFKERFFDAHAKTLLSPVTHNIATTNACRYYNINSDHFSFDRYIIATLGMKAFDKRYLSFQDIPSAERFEKLFEESGPYESVKNRATELLDATDVFPNIKAAHLLRRAQALSCAGCHDNAGGKPISGVSEAGGPLEWPESVDFVHIKEIDSGGVNESSKVSPALLFWFLPFRQCVLDTLLGMDPLEAGEGSAEVTLNPATAAEREEFTQLQTSVSEMLASRNLDARSFDELQKNVSKLRIFLQSEPGAFVRYRRSH
ncbi:hypothetical protein [Roseibium sp.]|uniref:hypothetical protein n=1 Tax=Roseibium sp. TaxID=1936156 RepID=UPI003A96E8F5